MTVLRVHWIITPTLDLRAGEAVNFAASPNIDFAPPGGELRNHAQRLVQAGLPDAGSLAQP